MRHIYSGIWQYGDALTQIKKQDRFLCVERYQSAAAPVPISKLGLAQDRLVSDVASLTWYCFYLCPFLPYMFPVSTSPLMKRCKKAISMHTAIHAFVWRIFFSVAFGHHTGAPMHLCLKKHPKRILMQSFIGHILPHQDCFFCSVLSICTWAF